MMARAMDTERPTLRALRDDLADASATLHVVAAAAAAGADPADLGRALRLVARTVEGAQEAAEALDPQEDERE